jgi:Predicted hydrolase (HAD superfamily)
MNTILFDLDGTLLPMQSTDKFLEVYLKAVAGKIIPYGYDPNIFIKALMTGTNHMVKNDGTMTNEQKFWDEFCKILGEDAKQLEEVFDDFYQNEFELARTTTSTEPIIKECISLLKEKGYQVAIATNPLFPKVAVHKRISWAGLDPEDFEHITTYEVSSYSKPNLDYYKEVLDILGKQPEECMMIGNDVLEDMCTAELGMDTFLLTDCLICPEDLNIDHLKQGNYQDLYQMIQQLPSIN